ncbi:unnamed protein product, partial [Plutella xylostella]
MGKDSLDRTLGILGYHISRALGPEHGPSSQPVTAVSSTSTCHVRDFVKETSRTPASVPSCRGHLQDTCEDVACSILRDISTNFGRELWAARSTSWRNNPEDISKVISIHLGSLGHLRSHHCGIRLQSRRVNFGPGRPRHVTRLTNLPTEPKRYCESLELEELADDAEERYNERSQLEGQYYELVSQARTLLEGQLDPAHNQVGPVSANCDTHACATNRQHLVNLPKVDLIPFAAMVMVGDRHGRLHKARLLLDNGSTANFVTDRLCTKLGLVRRDTSSTVTGIDNQATEERECEASFSEHTSRNADGRFVVTIPLKESPDVLGDSYNMARRRFMSLEKRFERDPVLKEHYTKFMQEYIDLGHMTENTINVPQDNK